MAEQSVKKPDLPDIASVLLAIHNDPVPRRDGWKTQNEVFRSLLEKQYPHMPEDELKQTIQRLRSKVTGHYKKFATRPIKRITGTGRHKVTLWEQRPFAALFSDGLSVFPQAHLDELDINWPSNVVDDEVEGDEDNCEGQEQAGSATTEHQGQPNASNSDRVDALPSSHGSTIVVESSKKRNADEDDSDGVIHVSSAQRRKRLKILVAPASGGTAVLKTRSCLALEDASDVQNQTRPDRSQEIEAPVLETRAIREDGRARVVSVSAAGLRKESSIAELDAVRKPSPRQSVARPVYDAIIPHLEWVDAQMRSIEFSIWQAAIAYSQEKGKDEMAVSKFVAKPEPELEALYNQVLGPNWQLRLCDIQDRGPQLKQVYVTQALFGAAIHRAVFAVDFQWDLRHEIDVGLNAHRKYFDAALEDLGMNAERLLKDIACRQASDRDYQKHAVAEQACRLAGATALTMQPHLQQLSRAADTAEPLQYKRWTSYLEGAFRTAITLKQITTSSELGPFEVRWPLSGECVDMGAHRLAYDLAQHSAAVANVTVLHGTLPGIWRNTGSEMIAFSMALVVPAESKEVGQ